MAVVNGVAQVVTAGLLMLAVSCVGSVRVTVLIATHPLASLTLTLYVPAVKLLAVVLVLPLLQLYVKLPVPPLALTLAEPVLLPLHNMLLGVNVFMLGAGLLLIAAIAVWVHALPSVTVTV